jgi:hypothetical protein
MTNKPQTNWVWQDEHSGSMMGVTVDLDRKTLQWFDAPGCACGDHEDMQSIGDFLQKGSRYLNPPDDVIAEMQSELRQFA